MMGGAWNVPRTLHLGYTGPEQNGGGDREEWALAARCFLEAQKSCREGPWVEAGGIV